MSQLVATPGRSVWAVVRERHGSARAEVVLVVVGAITIAISAVIHLSLWGREDGYRAVPKIGPLFLLQGIIGCVLALAMVGLRRVALTAIGAVYMAASIGGLYLSLHGGLFGYPETLDAPYVRLTLYVEIVGLVATLAACAITLLRPRRVRPAEHAVDARRTQ